VSGGFGPPLLIDADMLLYKAAAACEREVLWDDVNHVLSSNRNEAWDAVERQLATYRNACGQGQMYFALSGPGDSNFRRAIFPEYKAGRSRKPLCYGYIMEKLEDEYPCKRVETIEADDLLGIWATGGNLPGSIIISADKDLKTIPGRVYRDEEILKVSEFNADKFWMTQTLMGDVTDGYKGLPGCGAKGAEKVLEGKETLEDMWQAVLQAYTAKGLTYDDALLQARLARILRSDDWDTKKKEVILWEPK
jgi:DNA polymerase-1